MMNTYPGNLYVVAAPSGAGKSSLVKALMELDARVEHSVSHTTRAPRGQEFHGREYFFVSDEEFDAMVQSNAFLEWRMCMATVMARPSSRLRNELPKAWM